MKISRRAILGGGALLAAPRIVWAQAPIELKVTHWLPPVHQIHKWLTEWADQIANLSGNRLKMTILAAGQMGPPPRQYDLARTGVADVAYFLPGLTPGRFPVTDTLQLPFLFNKEGGIDKPLSTSVASGIATSVAGDLNARPEFDGTRILFVIASPTGGLFMGKTEVRKPGDLKGLRVRHNGPVGAAQLAAWGASPVAVPPAEVADALSKGTVDGMIFNYEGGRAFQIGSAVKHVAELNWLATPFTLVINRAKYDSLPADLRKIIDDTTGVAAARQVGALYDAAEAGGREYILKSGAQITKPTVSELNEFRAALSSVEQKMLAELDAKGLKATEIHGKIRKLVADARA